MIEIFADKQDLIYLLRGVLPKLWGGDLQLLLQKSFIKFVGNQHNEEFAWRDEILNSLTEQKLYELYLTIKN